MHKVTNEYSHQSILAMGSYQELIVSEANALKGMELYEFMLRLRRLEEAIMHEYHPADQMKCPVHFCVGQEAVPAALSMLISPNDYLFSHHRSHGYYLSKLGTMNALLAELYGREGGTNRGFAGSQELSMSSINFYSGAILSGAIAIATGLSFGLNVKRDKNVSVVGFGEAATEEGIFAESINLAAVHQLPIVYICENNGYSMASAQLKRQPSDNISERVSALGVRSESVFGNDVFEVHSTLERALTRARLGKGPTFIEAYTYRWYGHVGPEDDDHYGYRPYADIEAWKRNCPVMLLEKGLLKQGVLTNKLKSKLINKVDVEISEGFEFAKNDLPPILSDWKDLNFNPLSPMADKLLVDIESTDFDQNQANAIPGPY